MSKIFQIVFGLILLSTNCFAAATSTVIQPMSFGKILQTGEFTVITLYTNNEFTDIQNATILSNGHVGKVRYSVPDGESANITINPPPMITTEGNGCSISWANIVPSLNNVQETNDVNITAVIIINGTCANGTYSQTLPLNDGLNTNLPVSVTIGDGAGTTVGIRQIAPMDFGELLSPNTNGTVTLDYNGNRTPNGISFVSSKSAANGEFQIEGTAGARINVTFPDSVDMGRGMTVNNFNTDTGTVFTLSAEQQRMRVGARLNVPARIPSGQYSGSYTVTVSY